MIKIWENGLDVKYYPIIPDNVNTSGNNQYDSDIKKNDDQNLIKIENGEIKQGVFDKTIYQRTNGLTFAYNENGEDEARYLFDEGTKINLWLVSI